MEVGLGLRPMPDPLSLPIMFLSLSPLEMFMAWIRRLATATMISPMSTESGSPFVVSDTDDGATRPAPPPSMDQELCRCASGAGDGGH